MAVTDPGLSLRHRLEALARLPSLSRQFLAGLIRKKDTPSRIRFEATCRLDEVQAAATDLSEAERNAEKVLEDIKSRKATAEPVKSVFGGLDEK